MGHKGVYKYPVICSVLIRVDFEVKPKIYSPLYFESVCETLATVKPPPPPPKPPPPFHFRPPALPSQSAAATDTRSQSAAPFFPYKPHPLSLTENSSLPLADAPLRRNQLMPVVRRTPGQSSDDSSSATVRQQIPQPTPE
jgi:hypothetical protein